MEWTLILTIMATVIAIIGSNVVLISWLRSDIKAFEKKVKAWREELQKDQFLRK